jgi:hypothetical protein
VRCTISLRRKELGRIVLRAHVVNDTEELVRCSPGSKSDSRALLQTESELACEPHAELGFLFAIPRFRRGRSAFVRVNGTSFACGFETPIDDDTTAILASVGIAALLVGAIVGVVLYERKRRAGISRHVPPGVPDAAAPPEEPPPAPIVPTPPTAPAVMPPPALHELQARGFAALLDDNRAVVAALECTRPRFASSDFVARVVNQGTERLHCSVDGRTRRGAVRVVPRAFSIHPQSAAAVNVTVPLRVPWRVRTLHLRMESSAVSASAQADVPTPPAGRVLAGLAITLLVAGLCAAVFTFSRPRIVGFAVPSTLLAGTAATVSYSVAGIGGASYDVSANGATVARGTMPMGTGSVTFPTTARPATYRVTIGVRGPLGAIREARSIVASPRLVPVPASIGALAVDPGIAAAGARVLVRYAARADSGAISLVDVTGIALQSVPYSPQGTSVLMAPPVEAPTQYQVRLDVARGSSQTSTSVGLLVLPKPLSTPAPSPATASRVLTAAQLLRISPAYVVSARPFVVRLLSHPSNLQLTLQNKGGIPVATQSVAANASVVRFRAPYVARDESFSIIASFTRGSADQVVLDPIVVHAR